MSLWSRLVNVVYGDRLIRDIDEELESHIAEGIAEGRNPEEARRAFGAPLRQREASHDIRRVAWLADWLMDVRYAMRTLGRQPGFLFASVLSLALGVGANTAIFSLIDAVMLRALPVPEPQQLVQITHIYSDGQGPTSFSWPLFQYLRDRSHVFSGMFAQRTSVSRIDIDQHGAAERITAAFVSGNYFSVLRLTPAAGRLLVSEDDAPDAPGVAVISDGYWQRRFARDPSAVGSVFTVNNVPVTIVGVAPAAFFGTLPGTNPDMTLPLALTRLTSGAYAAWRRSDGFNFLSVMARLKPGTSPEQAAADVRAIFLSRAQAQAAQEPNQNERRRIVEQQLGAEPAQNGFNRLRVQFSRPLVILMAIVGLVLLLTGHAPAHVGAVTAGNHVAMKGACRTACPLRAWSG